MFSPNGIKNLSALYSWIRTALRWSMTPWATAVGTPSSPLPNPSNADTMGHSCGDALLREVAQSLARCLRSTDTVARFGGDEFLIMVNKKYIELSNNLHRIQERDELTVYYQPLTGRLRRRSIFFMAREEFAPLHRIKTSSCLVLHKKVYYGSDLSWWL